MCKSKIIKVLCPECRWQDVKRFKCVNCGRKIQPKDQVEILSDDGGHSYESYCPPRPRDMSPVTFYKKYGLVDKQFWRVTNGRYYCNPAHCRKSWKSKKARDEHLDMAYKLL